MRPAPGRPTLPRARARLSRARTLSEPKACCVMPIDQTKTAELRRPGTCRRTRAGPPRRRRSSPRARRACGGRTRSRTASKPVAWSATNRSSIAALLDQELQHAGREGLVAAGVDLEEGVGHARAEQGALGARRHPVPLQAGLAVRVDHRDPGALASAPGRGTSSSPAGRWRRSRPRARPGRPPSGRRRRSWSRSPPRPASGPPVEGAWQTRAALSTLLVPRKRATFWAT